MMVAREEQHRREMQAAGDALEASRGELERTIAAGEEERADLEAKISSLEQRLAEGDSEILNQLNTVTVEKVGVSF